MHRAVGIAGSGATRRCTEAAANSGAVADRPTWRHALGERRRACKAKDACRCQGSRRANPSPGSVPPVRCTLLLEGDAHDQFLQAHAAALKTEAVWTLLLDRSRNSQILWTLPGATAHRLWMALFGGSAAMAQSQGKSPARLFRTRIANGR